MFKLFNAALVCTVLVSAFFLYSLEHATRALERNITKAERQITQEREKIKLLNAEWANLTQPERVQKIAQEQLHLQNMKAQQYVPLAELKDHLPEEPPVKLEAQGSDAIGAMLEKLQ
ncbi:cell division protein FtsL [Aestuariivirga litoralis]|uniref:cell division protein FtsL n=1 Tax=Aestuariivirga litoralis TaxID=2650924 RepID=UPI0018C6EE98|nr:cell division protein FtsL [Aestuariivirga litoralis]MBG1231962.1 cell division protein FtsL [Aestuariivirga litoralis]